MRKKIIRLWAEITHRENITALVMIVAVGGIALALGMASFVFSYWRGWQVGKDARKTKNSAYMDELRKFSGITTKLEAVPDVTAGWKLYENGKYSFAIKYPQNWQNPKEVSPTADNKYLHRITFSGDGGNPRGFDVYIYSISRFPGPEGTDNLLKKNEQIPGEACVHFESISLGEEGYAAKEVDVKGVDPCFAETFFYSLAKGDYLFNIVPLEAGYNISDYDDKMTLIRTFPEFYDIVSTLRFEEKTQIVEMPQKVIQKAISPPKPRFTSGASCNHKNDKPRKSKTKGKHMDEDCCPDPDEWPNPRCAYSAKGLGIMISR